MDGSIDETNAFKFSLEKSSLYKQRTQGTGDDRSFGSCAKEPPHVHPKPNLPHVFRPYPVSGISDANLVIDCFWSTILPQLTNTLLYIESTNDDRLLSYLNLLNTRIVHCICKNGDARIIAEKSCRFPNIAFFSESMFSTLCARYCYSDLIIYQTLCYLSDSSARSYLSYLRRIVARSFGKIFICEPVQRVADRLSTHERLTLFILYRKRENYKTFFEEAKLKSKGLKYMHAGVNQPNYMAWALGF